MNVRFIVTYCLLITILNSIIITYYDINDLYSDIILYVTSDCIKYINFFVIVNLLKKIAYENRNLVNGTLFAISLCVPLPTSIYVMAFFKNTYDGSFIYNLLFCEQLVNIFLGICLIVFGVTND